MAVFMDKSPPRANISTRMAVLVETSTLYMHLSTKTGVFMDKRGKGSDF